MRGRRPVPNAVKLLNNNPGHRPLNGDEPQHDLIDPACPEDLTDPAARAEWERLIGTLTSRGHVTTVDRSVLLAYCEKYGQWRALEAAARGAPLIVTSPNGFPTPSPVFNMANKAFTLMLRAAVELGITPSSRSRIIATRPKDDRADAFATFQRALRPVK